MYNKFRFIYLTGKECYLCNVAFDYIIYFHIAVYYKYLDNTTSVNVIEIISGDFLFYSFINRRKKNEQILNHAEIKLQKRYRH